MKFALTQMVGLFRKELWIQGRLRSTILHRLFVGPLISSLTAGILYSGFFRMSSKVGEVWNFDGMTPQNFKPYLLCGFLLHTYLNGGYYCFSNKMAYEKWVRTLPLFWLAPCNSFLLFIGLCSVEILRSLIVTGFIVGLLALFYPLSPLFPFQMLLVFFLTFLTGLFLGLFRTGLLLCSEGNTEVIDTAYLGFIFTGCLYIPKALLPNFLGFFCDLNPVYHAKLLAVGFLEKDYSNTVSHMSVVLLVVIFLFTTYTFLWKKYRGYILEHSFA